MFTPCKVYPVISGLHVLAHAVLSAEEDLLIWQTLNLSFKTYRKDSVFLCLLMIPSFHCFCTWRILVQLHLAAYYLFPCLVHFLMNEPTDGYGHSFISTTLLLSTQPMAPIPQVRVEMCNNTFGCHNDWGQRYLMGQGMLHSMRCAGHCDPVPLVSQARVWQCTKPFHIRYISPSQPCETESFSPFPRWKILQHNEVLKAGLTSNTGKAGIWTLMLWF